TLLLRSSEQSSDATALREDLVIASQRSNPALATTFAQASGLLRRIAPRNDGSHAPRGRFPLSPSPEKALDSIHSSMVIRLWIACRLYIANAERSRRAVQNPRRPDAAGVVRTAVPRRRTDGRGADSAGRSFAAGRLKAPRGSQAGQAGARP